MNSLNLALVVEDHPLFSDALHIALNNSGFDHENIIHCKSLQEALPVVRTKLISAILLDLNLKDGSGFQAIKALQSAGYTGPVIGLSANETSHAICKAKSFGAAGYITKTSNIASITYSIRSVLDGNPIYPTLNMPHDTSTKMKQSKKNETLTPTQQCVMEHLSVGLLNKQIAHRMGISEATVKAHMTAIFRKLGANNRTQALLIYRDTFT